MAGGFMAGFGSAFANSYTQAKQVSAEKERDMFKLKYADYISRRDENVKEEKAAQAQIKAAKDAVARAGVPQEMWGEAYKMLRDGYNIQQLDEYLNTNQFAIEPTSVATGDSGASATAQDSLPMQAQGSVDAQMIESGMQPPADKGIFGNLKDKLGMGQETMSANTPTAQPQTSRRDQRVTSQIAEASGTTPEEVNTTLGPRTPKSEKAYGVPDVSFKATPKNKPLDVTDATNAETAARNVVLAEQTRDPEKIALAIKIRDNIMAVDAIQASNAARAQGFIEPNQGALMDEQGKFVGYVDKGPGDTWLDRNTGKPIENKNLVRPFDRAVQDDLTNITRETAKETVEYTKAASNFTTMLRDAKDMDNIVRSNPGVLGAKGWVAKITNNTVKDAVGVLSLLKTDENMKDNNPTAGLAQAQQAEAVVEDAYKNFASSGVGSNVEKMAIARAVIEAKAIRAAYQAAAAVGQTGQGVAAREFDRFYGSIMTPDDRAWKKQTSDMLSNEYLKLKQMEAGLNKYNPFITAFEQKHKFPAPVKAPSVDEYLNGTDPGAMKTLQSFQDYQTELSPDQPNPNQINSTVEVPEGYTPTGTYTKDGRPLYINKEGKKGTLN